MYEWIPPRTNKRAQSAILVLFLGAAALLFLSVLFPNLPYRWAVQLLAIGLLTAAIFLVTRYVSKIFIYRIIDVGNGSSDLTVTEAKAGAKGQITVCRVGLANIRSCRVIDETVDSGARAAISEIKKQRKKLFDYCVDLHPAQSILLTVEEGGEDLVLCLSYSPELVARLMPIESPSEDETDE